MRGATLFSARWATFALFFANGFGFGAWATAIAPLKALLSLSATSLSYALLAMAIGGVIAMQPASIIIERLGGTGRTTRLASIMFTIALSLPTLAPNLFGLILATSLLGAAFSIMDVSMNAHATSIERLWGSAIMSSFHAGWSLGGLAGTGFGAMLLIFGTPTPVLMLPVAAVVLIFVLVAAPHLGPGDIHRTKQSMAFRMPEKRLVGLALIVTFCFLVEGAMADWGGIYLTTIGETPARAAAGYGAFSAMMVAGRVLGDRIVRRFGRHAVISAGAAMAALGLVLATAVPTLIMIVAGFAMVGAGLSNVVPCVFSASAALGSTPAAGIATTSTAGYAGLLAGPPLIGAVAAHWGMRSGMGVIALAATAAVAISLRFRSAHQG